ncbi:MAG: hypothetical protein ACE5H2_04590 [Terriglobia bacterium]
MHETFLLLTFRDHTAARQACEQIAKWVKAFHLAHGQLAARRDVDANRVYVRLNFEAHEVSAYQRWLERIPREAQIAQAEEKTFLEGTEGFAVIRECFERLPEAD